MNHLHRLRKSIAAACIATSSIFTIHPTRAAENTPPSGPKNVIVFLTEDQGVDLGCMGTQGISTPHVDAFARSGVLFEKAFSLSPVCSPSKMAMFTGTYPHTNSGYRNVPNYGTDFPLTGDPSDLSLGGVHEDLPTLIEILREHGYFTATSHKTHVQPIRKWPYHKGYGDLTTATAAANCIRDLITTAGERPFYMTFGISSPHLPFRGILKNQNHWSDSGGLAGDGHTTQVDAKAIIVPDCYPDLPGVRQDIADYYGAIQCVDAVFGAVIHTLKETGMLDHTLVIYTSDHGIGLHRAKQSIYTAGTHIPLIIGGAGVTGQQRISAPVSHLDLVPTLLDHLSIPKTPAMLGKSLVPILSGQTTQVAGRTTIMTATHDKYDARAVSDGRYYYVHNIRKIRGSQLRIPQLNEQGIDTLLDKGLNTDQYSPESKWFNRTFTATVTANNTVARQLLADLLAGKVPTEELFDLAVDPWCIHNLAAKPEHATLKAGLRKELTHWRQATHDCDNSPATLKRRTLPIPTPPQN